MTTNDDDDYQIILIRMLVPVKMHLPCKVCLSKKEVTVHHC